MYINSCFFHIQASYWKSYKGFHLITDKMKHNKILTYLSVLAFSISFSCSTPTEIPVENQPLTLAEPAEDELIVKLRSMKYTDFNVIEVDNLSDLENRSLDTQNKVSPITDMSGAQLIPEGWWAGIPSGNPVWLQNNSDPYNDPSYKLETWVNLPASRVASGLGGRSTHNDFSNSGITGISVYSNYTLGNNPQLYKENTSNLEVNFALSPSANQDVVIGAGIRVSSSDLKGIWIYTAPYNPTTKKIDITSANDVNVYIYEAGPHGYLNQEVELRTWDIYGTTGAIQDKFIIGFGGSTHKSNATRVGLRIAKLQ